MIARVDIYGADKTAEPFETFELHMEAGTHTDLRSNTGGVEFTLFNPTDDDLRSIVAAAQGELDRRRGVSIGFDAACLCRCHREPFPDCDRVADAKDMQGPSEPKDAWTGANFRSPPDTLLHEHAKAEAR